MTWPAVLSAAAALRDLRTAARRRALEVALLVGGLFVLGFLCGGQAHAAETTGTVTSAETVSAASAGGGLDVDVHMDVNVDVDGKRAPARSRAEDLAGVPAAADPALSDPALSDSALPPGKLLHPVGSLVKSVADDLSEARHEAPPLAPPSSMPSLPSMPGWSDAPGLPALPALPGKPLPAPITATPTPPSVGHTPDSPAPPSGKQGSHRHAVVATVVAPYGPHLALGGTRGGTTAHTGAPRVTLPAHVPAQHTPGGGQSGVLGSQAALDNGTSRHGDAHALTPYLHLPLGLMPGTTARTDAAGTRDRYRDIPVFPA